MRRAPGPVSCRPSMISCSHLNGADLSAFVMLAWLNQALVRALMPCNRRTVMRALLVTTVMCGAAMLGACKAQTNKDANDVLNMENDAQAVPVNGGADTFGTSTTGAAAVQSSPLRTA